MNQIDALIFAQDILRLFHVRLQLFGADCQNLSGLDYGLREQLFRTYDYRRLLDAMTSGLAAGSRRSFVDAFGSRYLVLAPESTDAANACKWAVLGPYNYQPISEDKVDNLMNEYGLPPARREDLLFGLGRVPTIAQREFWLNLQITLVKHLLGQDDSMTFHTYNDDPDDFLDFSGEIFRTEEGNDAYPRTSLQSGYMWEKELLFAVQKGNLAQANQLTLQYVAFQTSYHLQFGLDSTYIPLELNVLLRRAAMDAGVHILRLDEIYVRYCKVFTPGATPPPPIQITYTDMVADYCKLVAKHAHPNRSAAVKYSLDYIDFNYQKDLSLHTLAAMCNVSDSYLSASFKKEIGITLTDYLNQTRVRHAKGLLRGTDTSVQEISGRCGFSDASYFTRIFKRYTGQSPQQFRGKQWSERDRTSAPGYKK